MMGSFFKLILYVYKNENNKRFKATTYGSLIALKSYNDFKELKNTGYKFLIVSRSEIVRAKLLPWKETLYPQMCL